MNRTVFIILVIVFILAFLSLATFVGRGAHPQSTFRIRPDEHTILFGVTPWGESLNTKSAYRPLLKYLSEKTGKKFQILVIEDYETAIDNIVEGNIDIAILPPVSYVLAKERRPGIQYISTMIRDKEGKGFATYKGYIVALKSQYDGWAFDDFLKEPKKYHFGFVTKESSSGWALHELGEELEA
jgi:ABC-type phosphate/phosphonate transport system substrate-binding protein